MEKIRLPVRQLLEWAFGREYAQLNLPDTRDHGTGFGVEYVLMQRAKLGVTIDAGRGGSDPHEDAEAVAGVVSRLDRPRAVLVAQVARSGIEPDWMEGAVPKIAPAAWLYNRHLGRRMGQQQKVGVYVETIKVRHPKNPRKFIRKSKHHDVMWVPTTWVLHPETIRAAREEYAAWASALREIHAGLQEVPMRRYAVTDQLPVVRPWETRAGGILAGATECR